jgi:opacity protein-like surface antigen
VTRRWIARAACALTLMLVATSPATAQGWSDVGVRGFGMVGNMTFTATKSFDAVLDRSSGPIFGGGVQVLLPWNIYFEAGAWRFRQDGERVFVGPTDEVFRLGIPVEITITPLEVTGGYRLRMFSAKFTPYAGVGYSSYRYKETSEFADPDENVDETFSGFHVQGGAEYQLFRWLAIGAEAAWTSVADAIGKGGVSAHYGEDNLGGTSLRLKISVGR